METLSKTRLAITPAAADDILVVIALAHRIWPVAYAGILTPEQIANMLERIYSPENLEGEMGQGHRFWIAYHGESPAGFVSGYRENQDIIWIKKIYVDPAVQGSGIGKQLIQTIISAFSPAREIKLLVNPHNIPAHRYYTHQGFIKIGEKPVKMGDWDFNDFVFARHLENEKI